MEILYCGISPAPGYPGSVQETYIDTISAMEAAKHDIIVWHWRLGEFPRSFISADVGLVLVSNTASLAFYRFAVECLCRQVLVGENLSCLTDSIRQEWAYLQEQRRNVSYRTLFQQYGDHLSMHLWYDLIVEGKYENLVESKPYRILLFQTKDIRDVQERKTPYQVTDSRTIISGIFPEAVVILALQVPWECVVLPGEIRKFPERAVQCQSALAQKLGAQRNAWQSPPLFPGEIHDFYQQTLMDAMRSQEQSVSSMVCSYIQTHLGEKLTRKTISDSLFFSPDYLAKVFLSETGVTMGAYICATRLEQAKEQLAQTSLPIGTIAAELGYQNFSEFSQWFKKQTGMVPSQYRKNNRETYI